MHTKQLPTTRTQLNPPPTNCCLNSGVRQCTPTEFLKRQKQKHEEDRRPPENRPDARSSKQGCGWGGGCSSGRAPPLGRGRHEGRQGLGGEGDPTAEGALLGAVGGPPLQVRRLAEVLVREDVLLQPLPPLPPPSGVGGAGVGPTPRCLWGGGDLPPPPSPGEIVPQHRSATASWRGVGVPTPTWQVSRDRRPGAHLPGVVPFCEGGMREKGLKAPRSSWGRGGGTCLGFSDTQYTQGWQGRRKGTLECRCVELCWVALGTQPALRKSDRVDARLPRSGRGPRGLTATAPSGLTFGVKPDVTAGW